MEIGRGHQISTGMLSCDWLATCPGVLTLNWKSGSTTDGWMKHSEDAV